jgi:hypothetical protein
VAAALVRARERAAHEPAADGEIRASRAAS